MDARAAPEPMALPWVVSVTMAGPADADVEAAASLVRDTYGMRSANVAVTNGLVAADLRMDAGSASAAIVLVDDLLLDVLGGDWVPVTIFVEAESGRERSRRRRTKTTAGR